jgi:tyrosine-protein kinase Etk/Wzc
MKNRKNFISTQESIFSKSVAMLVAYWPVFFAFAVLLISSAFIYLRYATPKYQATASIIIKDENKGNLDSKLMESLNFISQKKIIENEIEVLKSRTIVKDVVTKLHLYAPIFREGKISSFSAYGDAPLLIELQEPEKINGVSSKIYFNYNKSTSNVKLDNGLVFPTKEWVKTKYGVLRFLPNDKYLAIPNEKPFYFTLIDIDIIVRNLSKNLKVSATNKLSSIVNLQYTDNRPKLAEDVLKELISSYKNTELNEKNILARNTLQFIDQRLAVVRNDLDVIEGKIRTYKGNRNAVDIGTQGQLYLENVSANDKRIGELDMQLSVINELEKKVSVNDVKIGILPATLGVIDPTLSQLVNSLNTAELEQEKLKKTVAENNPILVSVKDQIANIKSKISENINSYRNSLVSSKENLYTNNRTYNEMLNGIPLKEQTLLEISRDNKIKSDIYTFLLQKREESELSYVANIVDTQVINYAQASKIPISPNRMLLFASVLIGMVVLPIGSINAREKLSKSVLYRNDIEQLSGMPVIAELSYNKSNFNKSNNTNDNASILDEFRRLRYSILSSGYGKSHRKIMVSSSITGEGKSFVATNLAKSFALAGKQVVLVDFDLHNSSLMDQFNANNVVGVSDYLANEASLNDIINPVQNTPNLFYISAGTLKNDPFSLLEGTLTADLMEYLDNNFDIVIMDTAPVIQVTDGYVLTSYCDITLFIVKHGYSPKRLVKILELNNETYLLKEPMIVFNGVRARGFLNNNYGYGYGYTMPYGRKAISGS